MKDIAELRQRLEDTKEGETICLDHEDATLILKQIEDLEEREPVHCKDCALNCYSPDHESVSYWIPCQEIKPEPHYFCWGGKQKVQKQN